MSDPSIAASPAAALDLSDHHALLESEARLRCLADAAWEGIGFTENGVIIDANYQLGDILGYAPEELIGKPLLELVAPGSHATVLRMVRLGGSNRYEHQAVRKDGTIITVEARGQTVPYKGRTVRVAAIRDITDRTRENARRRALVAGTAGVSGQHFFRSLVKHLARALSVKCAIVGELLPCGQRLRTLCAWSGDGYAELADCDLAGTPNAEVLSRGLRFYSGDLPEQFPGDTSLSGLGVTSYAGIPLQDSQSAMLGVLAIAHDGPLRLDDTLVSTIRIFGARAGVEIERIRAEAQIRRLNQDLEHRVVHRTRELEAANRELEAFSYSVSHDLRAPLRQIRAFVDLLVHDTGPGLTGTAHQHLVDIADCAGKMSELINTLLEFSRVGRADLRRGPVDLNELVREVAGTAARQATGRGAIEWTIHALPSVTCDAGLLRQVFVNLIANAVKYSRPRDPARIEIGAQPSETGGELVCFVRDNGVGFDMRRAHKLFGVFQRLHSSDKFEGTGIGLANVQRIIHRHGGRVWAHGEVDAGATFFFTLPTDDATKDLP